MSAKPPLSPADLILQWQHAYLAANCKTPPKVEYVVAERLFIVSDRRRDRPPLHLDHTRFAACVDRLIERAVELYGSITTSL